MSFSIAQQKLLVHFAEKYPKAQTFRSLRGVHKATYESLEQREFLRRITHPEKDNPYYQITAKGLVMIEKLKLGKLERNGEFVTGVQINRRRRLG